MDQVCFGKHGTAGSDFGDYTGVVEGDFAELIYAGQVQSGSLLIQKTAGTGGAGSVGIKMKIVAVGVKLNQAELFAADQQN